MKKITSTLLALFMVFQAIGPGIFALNVANATVKTESDDHEKVNICHKDGNSGNWNTLNVDINGWGGHSGHVHDYLYAGPLDDGKPDSNDNKDNNWCVNHVPVPDVCKNIDDNQAVLPEGMEFDQDGQCVPPPHHDEPCLVPVAVVDGAKIGGFGVSPEVTLQQVLDTAYPSASLNSVTSETGIQAWTIPSGTDSVTVDVKLVSASAGNTNELGYYFDGNTSSFASLFTVPGGSNSVSPVTATINTTGHTTIAFALKSGSTVFASEYTKNVGNEDHAVVYTPAAHTYAIAFEDVALGSADKDYNDLVAEVKVVSCTHGNQCVPSGSVVSDTTVNNVTDGNIPAVALTTIHPAWTASIPDATWIWATDPVVGPTNVADLTKVFTKKFTIAGTPTTGSLVIAADNNYSVKVNGNVVPVVFDQNNFQLETQDTYNVGAFLVTGENTLEITVTNWEVGQSADPAANPAGVLFKLDWSANCGGDNEHPTHTVTFHKYIDGVAAHDTDSSFALNWATGDSPTNPITLNSANSFTQTTSAIHESDAVSWTEAMGDNMVTSVESCTPGKYYNESFSWGNDLSGAVSNKSLNSSGIDGLSTNIHVVVWNKACPTKATVVATKIVCANEADLPNWGNGAGGTITANTAANFLASHDNCHAQPDWTFQWAPSVATNPGDNEMSAGSPWTTSGLTAADGTISIDIPVSSNGGFVWMREVPKSGYIPFSSDVSSEGGWNDVSAEVYCSVDHLNYDNFDRVDNMVAGQTYHCVAWNVPTHVTHECDDDECDNDGPKTGSLVVTKVVDNGNSEVKKVVSDFPLFIDGNGVVSGATTNGLSVGTHTVTETSLSHYNGVFSGDCDVAGHVTVAADQTAHCTLTNTFAPSVVVDSCTTNCGGGNNDTPSDDPKPQTGGHRHGGSVAGASTNVPNVGSVLGAATDVPNLPNTGNGARSQTLMITLSLIVALFAINAVVIRKMKNS